MTQNQNQKSRSEWKTGSKVRGLNPVCVERGTTAPNRVEGYLCAEQYDARCAGTRKSLEEVQRAAAGGYHHGNYVALEGLKILEPPPPTGFDVPKPGDRIVITKAPYCSTKEVAEMGVQVVSALLPGQLNTAEPHVRVRFDGGPAFYISGWEPAPAAWLPAVGDYVKVTRVRPSEKAGDVAAYAVGESFEVEYAAASWKYASWSYVCGPKGSVIGEVEKAERPAKPKPAPLFMPQKGDWVRVVAHASAPSGDRTQYTDDKIGDVVEVEGARASVGWPGFAKVFTENGTTIGLFEKVEAPAKPLPKAGEWIRITSVGSACDPLNVVGKPMQLRSDVTPGVADFYARFDHADVTGEFGYYFATFERCGAPKPEPAPKPYLPKPGELVRVLELPKNPERWGRIVAVGDEFYCASHAGTSRFDADGKANYDGAEEFACLFTTKNSQGFFARVEPVAQ